MLVTISVTTPRQLRRQLKREEAAAKKAREAAARSRRPQARSR